MQTHNHEILYEKTEPVYLIRWSAIASGLLGAFLILFLLNLLSTGLGFASLSPSKDSAIAVGSSVLIWLGLSSIISSYVGGWIAGKFCGSSAPLSGFYHGFLVSGLSVIIMIFVLTSTIGAAIGGSFTLLGKGIDVVGGGMDKTSSAAMNSLKSLNNISVDDIKKLSNKATDMLPESFTPAVNQIKDDLNSLTAHISSNAAAIAPDAQQSSEISEQAKVKITQFNDKVLPALVTFVKSVDTSNYDTARSQLLAALSETTGKSQAELSSMLDIWQKSIIEAKQRAEQIAKDLTNKAASALSYFSLINFFILTLGVFAASLGGYMAVRYVNRHIQSQELIGR